MRSRHLALISIALLVLFGCAREGFDVINASVERNITATVDADGNVAIEKESLVISYFVEPYNKNYTFKLTSPDGDLSWEGSLKGGRGKSDSLLLTPGASFEEGEYSLIIYSEEGEVHSSAVSLAAADYKDYPHFNNERILKGDATAIDLYKDGDKLETISQPSGYKLNGDSDEAVFSFKDRYGNNVKLTQSLN